MSIDAVVSRSIAMNSVTTGTDVSRNFSASSALPYSLVASLAFLVLLCIAYAINAADRQIFPALLPAIRQAFGYDLKTAGLMSSVFTIGLAVAGIPTGYLVDRVSRKAIILGAMVIYSVFTLATVYAFGFWDMLFYRALTGVGEGMQMAGLFAAVGAYFYRKRSFFISWMMLAYGVGAFLGPRIGSMLAQAANDWKTPFIWFAVTGLAIAAIVLVCVPKSFTESKGPSTVAAAEKTTLAYMPANLWNRNVIIGTLGCIVLGYSLYGYTCSRSSGSPCTTFRHRCRRNRSCHS